MVALGTFDACAEPERAAPAVHALDQGWIAALAADPESFEAKVAAGRDGWIALHRGDWAAAEALPGPAAGRARAELAAMDRVLDELSIRTWTTLAERWEARGGIPADSAFAALVADACELSGRDAAPWRARAATLPAAWPARREAHVRARAGQADFPGAGLAEPVAVEPIPGGERRWYDPLVPGTLARVRARGAAEPAPMDVFSPWLAGGANSEEDLGRLGLDATPWTDADDPAPCLDMARAMDAQLAAWKPALSARADEQGRALLGQLQLVEGARAQALLRVAAAAIAHARPECALAIASHALDHAHAREIGPLNPPLAFAVIAAAQARAGREREALDALEVLVPAYPEVVGLDETLGDLAVLDGMDRAGVSREN